MIAIERALWYVESHFNEDIDLREVAIAAGVSPYYLSRAFSSAVGLSVMRYARARRLTEAAKALARDGGDVSRVAIDAGYGSHEAFTRAFRARFGVAPKVVRAARSVRGLDLVGPIRLVARTAAAFEAPRLVRTGALLIVGLREIYDRRDSRGVPAQWQRFRPYQGNVPGQIGPTAYGVCRRIGDEVVEYTCGVEVSSEAEAPPELSVVRLPAQACAVFAWDGHAAAIHRLRLVVRERWGTLVDCDLRQGPGFERYGEGFDHDTGVGGAEIWWPLQPRPTRPSRRRARDHVDELASVAGQPAIRNDGA